MGLGNSGFFIKGAYASSRLLASALLYALKLVVMLSCDGGGASIKTKDQHARAEKVEQQKEPGSVLSLRSPPKLSAFLTDKSPSSLIHSRKNTFKET